MSHTMDGVYIGSLLKNLMIVSFVMISSKANCLWQCAMGFAERMRKTTGEGRGKLALLSNKQIRTLIVVYKKKRKPQNLILKMTDRHATGAR